MLVLPSKATQFDRILWNFISWRLVLYPRGDDLSKITEQVYYFGDPPAPLIGASFLIFEELELWEKVQIFQSFNV